MRFFSLFLPRFFSITFGAIGIIFFAIMVGGTATVVRASIMAFLVMLARVTGRTYDITRALFLTGFVMMLHNPKIVVFDSSFQLSFMATLALVYVSPRLSERLRLVPTKFHLRELFASTVATQLFVLPLILYMGGNLSLVALPVNLLVLLAIPATMFAGFLAGAASFVNSLIALPFAWGAYFLLTYELSVVDFFASLPFAAVVVRQFPLWAVLVIYALYGFALMGYGLRKAKKDKDSAMRM
jgi:competence protein ComEC